MNNVVVKIEMSGNRYNAFDSDGNKWTSEIGTGTRKGAYEKGMALERRISKTNGKNKRPQKKLSSQNFDLSSCIHIQFGRGI